MLHNTFAQIHMLQILPILRDATKEQGRRLSSRARTWKRIVKSDE